MFLRPLLLTSPLALAAILAMFTASCGDADHAVSIDVRTDFLAGDEFDAVHLTIDSATEQVMAERSEDYLAGVRIYDGELRSGDHEVIVALIQAGRSVVSRRVLFRVETDRGMTVVLTRSCATVRCDDATTCVSGTCVDPGCTTETPELCSDPECAVDTECARGLCGGASCVLGSCFQSDDGLCGAEAYCLPSLGCQMRELDGGVAMDAAVISDTGVDAGNSDSGVDGGGVDGGGVDSGPDSGADDTGPRDVGSVPTDSGGPDVPGPSGACRNAGDEGVLAGYTVDRGINDGFACYQMHGDNAGLLRTCVQGSVGVTVGCADCFVQIVQCTISNCSALCMNPVSASCVSCRGEFCDASFSSCTGYAI